MSGNFIIVAHFVGEIGSLRPPDKWAQLLVAIQGTKWISVAGFIPGAAGFTESERQMVNTTTTTSTQLLFPAVLSAFQLDVGLTLKSVLGGPFQSLLFLTNL